MRRWGGRRGGVESRGGTCQLLSKFIQAHPLYFAILPGTTHLKQPMETALPDNKNKNLSWNLSRKKQLAI